MSATNASDLGCLRIMSRDMSRQESDSSVDDLHSQRELIITGYFRVIESALGQKLPMDVIILVMLFF